jgi:RES domain-containing protein
MRAWRLARRPYADLSGEGARLAGGRWNSPGLPVVYLAAEASLALLEVRVHLDLPFDLLPADYVYMEVDLTGLAVEEAGLPDGPELCKILGDEWLASLRTPVLTLPSAIVPFSRNILLNPRHPAAASAKVTGIHPCVFDQRLW